MVTTASREEIGYGCDEMPSGYFNNCIQVTSIGSDIHDYHAKVFEENLDGKQVGEIRYVDSVKELRYFPFIGDIPVEDDTEEDLVNSPSHYLHGKYETIDEMVIVFGEEWVYHYCCCNAWKYRARAPFKGNMSQDSEKADWYLTKANQLKSRIEAKNSLEKGVNNG